MTDLLQRLTSRKFWLAVSAFAAFMAAKQYTEALIVAATYVGVEGAIDLKLPPPKGPPPPH
jgi:hypothetical protein